VSVPAAAACVMQKKDEVFFYTQESKVVDHPGASFFVVFTYLEKC